MSNPYYENDNPLVPGGLASAADINTNNDAIEAGFEAVNGVNNRSLKVPVGEESDQALTEGPEQRAGKVVGFNDEGAMMLYPNLQTAIDATDASASAAAASAVVAGEKATIATDQASIATYNAGIAAGAAADAAASADLALTHSELPPLSGNARKSLVVSADEQGVEWGNPLKRAPIFSAHAAQNNAVSAGEALTINNSCVAYPSTGRDFGKIFYAAGLFCAIECDVTSIGRVYTSPDGKIWTVRYLPSYANWCFGTDGTTIIAYKASTTETIKSTDGGVTWAPAGVLPANASSSASGCLPYIASNGSSFMVKGATGYFLSTDSGDTWTAVTGRVEGLIFAVGNYYVQFIEAIAAYVNWSSMYYSSTGEDGSWVTFNSSILSTSARYTIGNNGEMFFCEVGVGKQVYKLTETSFPEVAAVEGVFSMTDYQVPAEINGIFAVMYIPAVSTAKAPTDFVTFHKNGPVARLGPNGSKMFSSPYFHGATDGTTTVLPGEDYTVITITEADSATGIFEEN